MSNGRAHRRQRRQTPSMGPAAVRVVVALAAAIAKCDCAYDVRHGGDNVTLRHDHDCPAIDAPSMWWTGPPRRRR